MQRPLRISSWWRAFAVDTRAVGLPVARAAVMPRVVRPDCVAPTVIIMPSGAPTAVPTRSPTAAPITPMLEVVSVLPGLSEYKV